MNLAPPTLNIAARFEAVAASKPEACALECDRGRFSYGELAARADAYAHHLAAEGVVAGMRTAMMVPPGPDFFALVFALFKLGAVPVFVDPTMGFKHMGRVLAEAAPEAFVGIPKAHLARVLGGWGKATLKVKLGVGGGFWGAKRLYATPTPPFPAIPRPADAVAAVLFTSGSTGVPKGAMHTHGSFDAQADFVRDQFAVEPGEVHVAAFPIFALFDLALGATAVLPGVDVSRPARIDPKAIIAAVDEARATCLFGSPALLENLGRAGGQRPEAGLMPSLKAIISASGPVLPPALERLDRVLNPHTTVWVPYGATEGLPISVIGHREALRLAPEWAAGQGLCIGRPLASVRLELLAVTDAAIAEWSEALPLGPGAVGEIVVKGPIVSPGYLARPDSDRLAKIPDPAGGVWHRMGDLGRVDAQGLLWFYGRKAHRVTTPTGPMFTLPCEAIFLQHPYVARAALVGVGSAGQQTPVMCLQLEPGTRAADGALRRELLAWAAAHPHTAAIEQLLFHPSFPVDIRHNSKIFREALAIWAAKQVKA